MASVFLADRRVLFEHRETAPAASRHQLIQRRGAGCQHVCGVGVAQIVSADWRNAGTCARALDGVVQSVRTPQATVQREDTSVRGGLERHVHPRGESLESKLTATVEVDDAGGDAGGGGIGA